MQPTNRQSSRPLPSLTIGLWTASLLIAAALTGYFGLYAAGYLVPAACLLLQATLLFSGRGKTAFVTIMALNQISGLVLVLVLAFGDALGGRKLDVSAVALLVNLATGGPLMGLLSLPLFGALRFNRSLADWFGARRSPTLNEALSI